ncbi:MAG: HlyD family secretion protein [Hyphomonadaceae bacterium]
MEGSFAHREQTRLRGLLDGAMARRARAVARNRIFLFAIGPAVLALAALVYFVLTYGRVSTDDATVAAARAAISPEVRGRIVEVYVHDNQVVRKGDPLVRLGAESFRNALADAQAQLAAARLHVAALRAAYGEAAAQALAARATRAYAQSELTRKRNLFHAGVISRQDLDGASHQADLAARQAAAADQAAAAALANIGGAPRDDIDQHPQVQQALAALENAQDNMGYTIVHAPTDGVVARVDQIQIGAYAQPTETLFWLISGAPWVDAAFKENQLENIRPGQPAEIRIDAYPHHKFRGHVVSLSPGTGSSFSVLPTQNTSGNWVKVVQRLTVRIAFDDVPENVALAVGLSATATVDTRAGGGAPSLRGREQ